MSSPSHSQQHTDENDNIEAIETKLGVDGSADASSIDYKVTNAASNGGGHVQTANKGGTGQTSYNKGDVLVATSSSVLAKLAVGTDGQALVANSSVFAGLGYRAFPGKVATSASVQTVVYLASVLGERSVLSINLPGSILGNSNAVRTRVFIGNYQGGTTSSVLVRALYGSNQVASVMLKPLYSASVMQGTIDYTLIANANTSLQRVFLEPSLRQVPIDPTSSVLSTYQFFTGTSSIISDAPQTLGLTVKTSGAVTSEVFEVTGYTVEKIS